MFIGSGKELDGPWSAKFFFKGDDGTFSELTVCLNVMNLSINKPKFKPIMGTIWFAI